MSTLSDFGAERRQAARTTVESLTYISFGANNRGIVLDISEGGLRFRVLSPIEDTQPLHVWFSAEGNRIDAEGEVIWMDEQQVTGGLRFKSLSAENREQIRNWIAQPAASLGEGEKPVLRQLVAAVPIGKTTALGKLRSTTQLLKSKQRANAGVFARGLFSGPCRRRRCGRGDPAARGAAKFWRSADSDRTAARIREPRRRSRWSKLRTRRD